jgi:hypothetical protein
VLRCRGSVRELKSASISSHLQLSQLYADQTGCHCCNMCNTPKHPHVEVSAWRLLAAVPTGWIDHNTIPVMV